MEDQRKKIIVLERHVLETAAFDFRSQHPQPYIIKFTKFMERANLTFDIVPQDLALLAWKIALDGYRTFAPLKYPPHILALAHITLSTLLIPSRSSPQVPFNTFAASQDDVYAVI